MKRSIDKTRPSDATQQVGPPTPALHDYRTALEGAVSWLGNRYLLAEPVARRTDDRKPFYGESRRWHPATRH